MSNRTARPSDMLQRELGLIEPVAGPVTQPVTQPVTGPTPHSADRAPSASVQTTRRRRWNSLVWGAAGFVAGALFWHSIGFWSFVQTTLVPTPDSRRAEREAGSADTRMSHTSNSPSPVRPLRTSAKIGGRHEPSAPTGSPSTAVGTPALVQTGPPVAAPPLASASTNAVDVQPNCTAIARAKDGAGGAVQSCTLAPVPLLEGAGLAIADKQPVRVQGVKPAETAKAAPLMWQAKVEVNTAGR
jgi:hypothetical protein